MPYPDLGDPWTAARQARDPRWYALETAKALVQAYGRSCRHAGDHGTTYVLDAQFQRFLTRYRPLLPPWFLDAAEARCGKRSARGRSRGRRIGGPATMRPCSRTTSRTSRGSRARAVTGGSREVRALPDGLFQRPAGPASTLAAVRVWADLRPAAPPLRMALMQVSKEFQFDAAHRILG